MKYKTTQKAVKAGYTNTIAVNYCALQNLLAYENAVAYTARSEGWGADIYGFGNTAIVTGYAPFGNIRPDYNLCKKYEDQAEKIRYNNSLTWQEQRDKLHDLISEFIAEVLR